MWPKQMVENSAPGIVQLSHILILSQPWNSYVMKDTELFVGG